MKGGRLLDGLLLGTSLGLSLALGELVLRALDRPKTAVSGWRSGTPPQETNQLGFRGATIVYLPDDFVVVLVGDSQVQATVQRLPYAARPELRLEESLNERLGGSPRVRVFALGANGYGQDQEFLVLKEYYSRFRASLVVLWETPINDIWNNQFPTHWPKDGQPKPTFWLEGGRLQGPSEAMGAPVPPLKLLALYRNLVPQSRDGSWERHLPPAYVPLSKPAGPVDKSWQAAWDQRLGIVRDENLGSEKSHFALSLTPRSPRMQYGIDLTRALLKQVENLVTARGGSLVLFAAVPPPQFENLYVPSPGSEKVCELNGKFYRVSRQQFDKNIEDLNRGFDFRPIPITVQEWRAVPTDIHLNQAADDQVMRDLSEQLVRQIRR